MFEFDFSGPGDGPRVGRLTTPHGPIDTPAFMPVGTQATVKGLTGRMLAETGTQVVLANAYHLLVRPGAEVIEQLGGLHRVMAWDGAVLTDSGGYQVFSLGAIRRVRDDGVLFANHVDGGEVLLTPQSAMDAQRRLGADLVMALDECVGADATRQQAEQAARRTAVWARQCLQAHAGGGQMLLAIVQGGMFPDLRRRCVEELAAMGFAGYAVGGLSVGEGQARMLDVLVPTAAALPADRPRYLMGVGQPADILAAVAAGCDLFDCVLPTRNGRNGLAFAADGPLRLRNERFKADGRAIEPDCDCQACARYSRGTLRHLFLAEEMLGPVLVSLHNVRFYQRLMASVRVAVRGGTFAGFRRQWLARFQAGGPGEGTGDGDGRRPR